VKPLRATSALPQDPDDAAIWVHKADPSRSLILGTMKVAAPDGGLAVFGLDGIMHQFLKGPDRPNNVDVEYGLDLDATPTDIAVLTERLGRRLRVYAIARDGSGLRDVSAGKLPILA
jgi:3-phytase